MERTEYTELEIEFGLEQFVERANTLVSEYGKKNFPNLDFEQITVKPGRAYWKLVKNMTVYGFVRKSDGAILKAAFGAHAATPYGIRYQTGAGT